MNSPASDDFKSSAAVTEFGMLLRDSEFKGLSSFATVLELARTGKGPDRYGYRPEFIRLVEICSLLDRIANRFLLSPLSRLRRRSPRPRPRSS